MASNDTLVVFTPLANEPPASGYATLDQRNGRACLDFDATTQELAAFSGVMPRNYAGGGITVYLHWRASSATSGTCRWGTQFEAGTSDNDSDSFASALSAGGTASATSGIRTVTSIAHANGSEIDSIAVGDEFRLHVVRDAAGLSGTDDMTGDGELYKVELKET